MLNPLKYRRHTQSGMATASAAISKCDDGTENSEQKQDQIDYGSLFRAVFTSDSESALAILDEHPGAVTAQLAGTTALHAAVADRSSVQLVKYLVDLMAPDSLKQCDAFGRTALHVAAMAGNTEAANILVEKNPGLLHETDKKDELPLHHAARHAHKETVRCLLSVRDGYPKGAISGYSGYLLRRLLIFADFYDMALEVLKRLSVSALLTDSPEQEEELVESVYLEWTLEQLAGRPEAFARRHHRHRFCLSAPHHCFCNSEHYMKKPSQYGFFQKSTDRAEFECPHAIDLLRLLIGEISKREQESDGTDAYVTATERLGNQLCTAAKFGNYEAVVEILWARPTVLFSTAEHGFLQVAVMNGQERVFNLLYQLGSLKHHLLQARDISGNNILHLAARCQPPSTSTAVLQVQRDLQWFKKMERNVPPILKSQINIDGKTPREVFAEEHRDLLKEGAEWVKKSAESCSVVAILVVTVVFAAAFTVPGGNNDSNGIPNYLTDASFMTFAISDILGLVSSITSLLMFLSILISGIKEEDLLKHERHKRLGIGLVILFFSIASMLVTFTASLHIVLGHRVKWIAVPIGILVALPVILFASLQFPLLVDIVYWESPPIFWGRKVRSCFRCCS